MTRRSLEKFANSTCRALQLTVVGLLGGVDVLLDQKRARHLDNNLKKKKQLGDKLFPPLRDTAVSIGSLRATHAARVQRRVHGRAQHKWKQCRGLP